MLSIQICGRPVGIENIARYCTGATYGRVICRVSMIISAPAEKAWKVASQFGNIGSWL